MLERRADAFVSRINLHGERLLRDLRTVLINFKVRRYVMPE